MDEKTKDNPKKRLSDDGKDSTKGQRRKTQRLSGKKHVEPFPFFDQMYDSDDPNNSVTSDDFVVNVILPEGHMHKRMDSPPGNES